MEWATVVIAALGLGATLLAAHMSNAGQRSREHSQTRIRVFFEVLDQLLGLHQAMVRTHRRVSLTTGPPFATEDRRDLQAMAEAFQQALDEGRPTSNRLWLVGDGDVAEAYVEALQQLATITAKWADDPMQPPDDFSAVPLIEAMRKSMGYDILPLRERLAGAWVPATAPDGASRGQG